MLTSFTGTVNVGKLSVWFAETGWKPELKPPLNVQGLSNDDWVAVWFFCSNWKTR